MELGSYVRLSIFEEYFYLSSLNQKRHLFIEITIVESLIKLLKNNLLKFIFAYT